MNQSITIRLEWPPLALSPNARPKRWQLLKAKHDYRFDCKVDTLNARDGKTEYPLKGPLEAHAYFHITRGNGPDVDNALASLKAGIDGIADAGVITNDRDIKTWQAEVVKGPSRYVELIISEVA